jgi:5-methylcytosine-specific restriction enzyme A
MGYCFPFHTLHSIIMGGIDRMFNEEVEILEEMLRNKMIEDADKFVKHTYNWEYYRSCDNRRLVISAMQKAAHKLNYKFKLNFEGRRISYIKWYHNDIWISIINGFNLPLLPEKNIKPKRNPIPGVLRHEVFHRDGYRCLECGATNHETSLEVDHIIPVAQGGTDELDNLQTLCRTCNQAKGNRAWTASPAKAK